MASDTSGDRMRSLGDLIAALRPGDDCPWCGARLQGASAMLVCPECGFEVCAMGDVERIHARRALGAAA